MTVVNCSDERFVCVGDTPVLEFVFREADDRTVSDLTDHCGWVSFSYPGSRPHVLRAGRIAGTPKVLRYYCRGDEFSLFGQIRIQPTVMLIDRAEGVNRSWHQRSLPVTTWNVIARPT